MITRVATWAWPNLSQHDPSVPKVAYIGRDCSDLGQVRACVLCGFCWLKAGLGSYNFVEALVCNSWKVDTGPHGL